MIRAWIIRDGAWQAADSPDRREIGAGCWLDLVHPSPEELARVEKLLGIEIPTRADMEEIEHSSRIYQENGTHFMTAMVLSVPEAENLHSSAITFVYAETFLVTVRYHEPRPFEAFAARLLRPGGSCRTSLEVLIGLLETIIDRMADIMEFHSAEVEKTSRLIFSRKKKTSAKVSLQETLRDIGTEGNHISTMRESLASVSRVAIFLNQATANKQESDEVRTRMQVIGQDVNSLADYATFMANKVTFLLEATLGMIDIQQNNIIKIVSLVAVVFLPPTLIASIYGMNFKFIPELEWELGYLLAVFLMIVSAVLPYAYFKHKGWL
jgi:magnesium transporter